MTIVVNIKNEHCDVNIMRPSKWGNPFSHKKNTLAKFKTKSRKESIEKYREYLLSNKELMDSLSELKDKKIGCVCFPKDCHGNILAELVNNLDKNSIF